MLFMGILYMFIVLIAIYYVTAIGHVFGIWKITQRPIKGSIFIPFYQWFR